MPALPARAATALRLSAWAAVAAPGAAWVGEAATGRMEAAAGSPRPPLNDWLHGERLDDSVFLLQHQLETGTSAGSQSVAKSSHIPLSLIRDSAVGTGNHTESEDFPHKDDFCRGMETMLQRVYEKRCNVNRKVTCVWGDTDYCPAGTSEYTCHAIARSFFNPLSMRSTFKPRGLACGYVPDNAFVKFNSYTCETRTIIPISGSLSCTVSLTPLAIVILVIFWLGLALSCLTFLYFCCIRPWQKRASVSGQPQQSPQPGAGVAVVDRTTMLLGAAQRGDTAGVEGALQAGVSVNARSRANATALISAAQFGHYQVVAILLKAGADPNLATNAGNTAVLLAAIRGHHDVIKLLLQWGADPRKPNGQGWSAIDVPGVQGLLPRPGVT